MNPTYETFQKFNDPELADIVARQLRDHGIDSSIETEGPLLDAVYIGNSLDATTHLKIAPEDFVRAHAVLEEYYQSQLQHLEPDYYLFSFTNEELVQIVQRPDEWGHLDYALAKKLLADRGQEITPEQADSYKRQRKEELAKPETVHNKQILGGYAAVLVCCFGGMTGAVYGLWTGFLALVLGSMLAYMKKTLPDGERVYFYSEAERKHGRRIMLLGAIGIPVWFILLLFHAGRITLQKPF